jgi:hypothetical protein
LADFQFRRIEIPRRAFPIPELSVIDPRPACGTSNPVYFDTLTSHGFTVEVDEKKTKG